MKGNAGGGGGEEADAMEPRNFPWRIERHFLVKVVEILGYHCFYSITDRRVNAEVELWDCGSTGNAESCWPIFAKGVNGLLFTFNQVFCVELGVVEKLE